LHFHLSNLLLPLESSLHEASRFCQKNGNSEKQASRSCDVKQVMACVQVDSMS
jgi:hypothetical protein